MPTGTTTVLTDTSSAGSGGFSAGTYTLINYPTASGTELSKGGSPVWACRVL